MRARSLIRTGRSQRSVAAHLAARGVDAPTRHAALPDDPQAELAAAVALTRRRRIGPFAEALPDAEATRRALGMLGRAGFSHEVALRALRLARTTADAMLRALREA